jgi:hypothetical protein
MLRALGRFFGGCFLGGAQQPYPQKKTPQKIALFKKKDSVIPEL